eukprot:2860288-Rhodomonas_salina.3
MAMPLLCHWHQNHAQHLDQLGPCRVPDLGSRSASLSESHWQASLPLPVTRWRCSGHARRPLAAHLLALPGAALVHAQP